MWIVKACIRVSSATRHVVGRRLTDRDWVTWPFKGPTRGIAVALDEDAQGVFSGPRHKQKFTVANGHDMRSQLKVDLLAGLIDGEDGKHGEGLEVYEAEVFFVRN